MSVTDPAADPVQPEEGQGEGGTGDSPFSEYLNRINDEEARAVAEEGFKHFDANATKKFQEHSSYRKQWEPFEEIGIRERDPESVKWALQVAELAQTDPAAFAKWAAENYGTPEETAPEPLDEFALQDPQALEQLLEQRLQQRLSPFEQQLQQMASQFEEQAQERAQQQAAQFLEGQIAELEKKHGDQFDRDAIELLLPHFTESARTREDLEQAVPRAFEKLLELRSKHEKAALQAKVGAPAPAETGGVPNVQLDQPKTLQDAKVEALKVWKQFNQQ